MVRLNSSISQILFYDDIFDLSISRIFFLVFFFIVIEICKKRALEEKKKLKEVSSSLTWDALSSIMTSLMTCTLTASEPI